PVLSLQEAQDHIERQCFSGAEEHTVGIELEMFPVPASGTWPAVAVPIDTVQDAIAPHLPLPAGSSVTFEPGGQLELSSPPQADAAAACAALAADVAAVTAALEPTG